MTELTLETLRAELAPLGGEIANLVDNVTIIARSLDFHRLPTEQPATENHARRDRQACKLPITFQLSVGDYGAAVSNAGPVARTTLLQGAGVVEGGQSPTEQRSSQKGG